MILFHCAMIMILLAFRRALSNLQIDINNFR